VKGMGAFCVGCKAKNASGTMTGDELLIQYPNGCHYCSNAFVGPPAKAAKTRSDLAAMIKDLGYAFLDMEGDPLLPTSKKGK